MPKVIDLFCGCGGMSWGFQKKGFEIIAGIDINPVALTTFKYNHPEALVINDDIKDIEPSELMRKLSLGIQELDVLIGGPPCQGFSKNVPASNRFLEDERNQLYKEFLLYAKKLLPKVIVIENVAELYNAYGGHVRHEIINELQEIGYQVRVKVLNAFDFGVPQKRRRCIFIASRTKNAIGFPKKESAYLGAWDAISDLPKLNMGEGSDPQEYTELPQNDFQKYMRRNSHNVRNHIAKSMTTIQYERVCSLEPGQGYKDLPKHLKPKTGYSGAYGRLDFSTPSSTITRWVHHSGSGRYCHPREKRLITMREAARLQSFSDDFVFLGTYTQQAEQIGNAVPPILMEKIAEEALKVI